MTVDQPLPLPKGVRIWPSRNPSFRAPRSRRCGYCSLSLRCWRALTTWRRKPAISRAGRSDVADVRTSVPGLQRPRWSAADGSGFLAVVLVALWPVWSWSVDRFLDGSDEPWGIVAIGDARSLLLRDRARSRGPPRTGWLVAASAATCAAVVTTGWLPALMRGVFASLAVTATLMAVRKDAARCLRI